MLFRSDTGKSAKDERVAAGSGVRTSRDAQGPKVCRFFAGGKWIRTTGSASRAFLRVRRCRRDEPLGPRLQGPKVCRLFAGGGRIRTIGPSRTTSTRIGLNKAPERTDAAPRIVSGSARAFHGCARISADLAHKEARRNDCRESGGAARGSSGQPRVQAPGHAGMLCPTSAGGRGVCP